MPRGRPLVPLTLTDEQEDQLNGIAQSATLPYALVVRARMILASAEGLTNSAVARRCGVTQQTVGKWRRRFRAAGIEGLHDELRPGRPRTYDDDKVAAVISRALQESPDAATHWSTRTLGRAEGLSKSTVQRWFAFFGVKPHLAKTFKLSTDPFFIEKVRDIVGLYLNPPDHAMVLCRYDDPLRGWRHPLQYGQRDAPLPRRPAHSSVAGAVRLRRAAVLVRAAADDELGVRRLMLGLTMTTTDDDDRDGAVGTANGRR